MRTPGLGSSRAGRVPARSPKGREAARAVPGLRRLSQPGRRGRALPPTPEAPPGRCGRGSGRSGGCGDGAAGMGLRGAPAAAGPDRGQGPSGAGEQPLGERGQPWATGAGGWGRLRGGLAGVTAVGETCRVSAVRGHPLVRGMLLRGGRRCAGETDVPQA